MQISIFFLVKVFVCRKNSLIFAAENHQEVMKSHSLYNIKHLFAALNVAVLALLFAGCSDSKRMAQISGEVANADGQLLALVHLTDGAPKLIDTLRLDASGKFAFKAEAEQGPDFFALNLGNQTISLVVDTLLTPVSVKADAEKFGNNYEVADELNNQFKEALLKGNRLRRQVLDINAAAGKGLAVEAARDSILAVVNTYKQDVLTNYIFANPASPVSYYLLFETVQGLSIFTPADVQDLRAFGAVATNWDATYPASPRNKILKQMTIEGQQLRRQAAAQAQRTDSILSNTKIQERTYPEINLPDADDHLTSLSSLVDAGGVVLVDYTAYYMPFSPAHNMVLGKLFDEYSAKGLKIYQVCLDFDENFWKVSADNLPWTTVRDSECTYFEDGNIQYSPSAAIYNLTVVPTTFIIGKGGELKTRIEQDDVKLEAEVKKLFK